MQGQSDAEAGVVVPVRRGGPIPRSPRLKASIATSPARIAARGAGRLDPDGMADGAGGGEGARGGRERRVDGGMREGVEGGRGWLMGGRRRRRRNW